MYERRVKLVVRSKPQLSGFELTEEATAAGAARENITDTRDRAVSCVTRRVRAR